ncbi:PREDICTED: protein S100-P-like [Nanorana parkeri]|uniref:protein S100-P-like n=1 Tax=Nanorana parkeri TaxID=125878 RepID=UPI00085413D4|nr:PREDICTED: protein S100-P-like [Nanorana parkeri]
MSELETAMVLIMDVFDKYAGAEGKKGTLTKTEMKNLLENEFPMFIQAGKGKDDCDKLINDLDENGDSEVDFQEFVILVVTFTCLVHERFQESILK